MSASAIACLALFVLGVLTFLVQLWLAPWTPDTFWKLILTYGALFLVSFVVNFLLRESRLSERIARDDRLDG